MTQCHNKLFKNAMAAGTNECLNLFVLTVSAARRKQLKHIVKRMAIGQKLPAWAFFTFLSSHSWGRSFRLLPAILLHTFMMPRSLFLLLMSSEP